MDRFEHPLNLQDDCLENKILSCGQAQKRINLLRSYQLSYSGHLLSKKMCRFKNVQYRPPLFNIFLWLNKLIVEHQSVKKPRE